MSNQSNPLGIGQAAFTKAQFRARNAISHGLFYKLRRAGKGPREMENGRISAEAEADWQRDQEARAPAKEQAAREAGAAAKEARAAAKAQAARDEKAA